MIECAVISNLAIGKANIISNKALRRGAGSIGNNKDHGRISPTYKREAQVKRPGGTGGRVYCQGDSRVNKGNGAGMRACQ